MYQNITDHGGGKLTCIHTLISQLRLTPSGTSTLVHIPISHPVVESEKNDCYTFSFRTSITKNIRTVHLEKNIQRYMCCCVCKVENGVNGNGASVDPPSDSSPGRSRSPSEWLVRNGPQTLLFSRPSSTQINRDPELLTQVIYAKETFPDM